MPPLPHLLICERWQMILTATADLAASSLAFPPSPSLRVVAEDPHGSDRLGRELTGPAVKRSNDYLQWRGATTISLRALNSSGERWQPRLQQAATTTTSPVLFLFSPESVSRGSGLAQYVALSCVSVAPDPRHDKATRTSVGRAWCRETLVPTATSV